MPPKQKTKTPVVTVGDFYTRHSQVLQLKLLNSARGLERRIREPTVNRAGLALTGFYQYFADKRIQILGSAEFAYVNSLEGKVAAERLLQFCSQPIPAIIICRSHRPPRALLEAADAQGVAVFRTPMVTMNFISAATIALDTEFAPTRTEYGSMVDIVGTGVLIRGSSGIGKSECVIGLIERGHSLVSDDVTRLRSFEGRELIGTSPDLTRHHMEVRGLGIINVSLVFGVGAIRMEKRLDLIVTLKDWQELEEVDRIGLDREYYEILNILVPHITIPVRVGRDLARLVEVAALDQKLKSMGQNSAVEFNRKLLNQMQKNKEL